MRNSYAALFVSFLLFLVWVGMEGSTAPQPSPPPKPRLKWYKGNTHTHTLNSDGDSTPDEVVRWYREHGYHFLVLTDHNFLTHVDGLNALHGADEKFLVIRGEEVSDQFGGKPLHINGLHLKRLVKPQGGSSVVETLQRNVDAIRKESGVPHINHPNFGWAITADELRQVRNNKLFEIYNGHPHVNNQGGGGVPGLEAVWDAILSSGKLLYGIAVDDAHVFKRPWDRGAARPGQGWVVVRAERLSPDALLDAMERGDFYASTGVELADYRADDKSITITIREVPSSKYRVRFIGRGGRILSEAVTNPAVYRITGEEGYVRAKILESNGSVAWTQPIMLGKAEAQEAR
ncbi:MAG: CehA/McbA family metallohydrolase [Armatimonadetes bacterium]|nr:CehA/McbA family metallohydrolase [Armatimonadota bacterium]